MKRLLMGLLCVALVALFCVGVGAIAAKADSDGNDTFQKATKITSKDVLTGVLSDRDDTDWFAYTVEEDGPFSFKMANISGSHSTWYLTVYDVDAAKLDTYDNFNTEAISTRLYSFKKGCTIYVCIKNWEYESAVNKEYSLQVINGTEPKYGYELKGHWESEDNDNKITANKLEKANPIYGMIGLFSDKDVYKYEVAGDGNFSFKIENQTSSGIEWRLTVYDSDYNQIKKYNNQSSQYTLNTESMQGNIGDVIYVEISKVGYNYENIACVGGAYLISVDDKSKASSNSDSSDSITDLSKPFSILAGTNVIVGKAEAGATVYVKQGKKTYSAVADSNGIYRVKTAKLGKGKSVKIWQKIGKTTSKKVTVKVVESY